jgi:hypothetical protein
MPREFKHLVMTNIRRIAHTPHEAECIARFQVMWVILVCVAFAARKSWHAGRSVSTDPAKDEMPDGGDSHTPAGSGYEDRISQIYQAYRFAHCGKFLPAPGSSSILRPELFFRPIPACAVDPLPGMVAIPPH